MFKRLEREEELAVFLAQNQKQVRLVKFSAEWCPPCRELKENLKELIKENSQVAILEVDVGEFRNSLSELCREISQLTQQSEFQVSALPTLLLCSNRLHTHNQQLLFLLQ